VWLAAHPGLRRRPAPSRYAGSFAPRGLILRAPGGNVENFAEQKAAGVTWCALNVGPEVHPDKWTAQRMGAAAHGIQALPWRQCFSPRDLDDLLTVAGGWSTGALVNVENEILTSLSPSYLAKRLDQFPYECALVVLGWVQNGQGWKALAEHMVFLEVFTQEHNELTAAVCEAHARAEGLKHVGFCWGAYPMGGVHPEPSLYPLHEDEPQCIYTGDDVGPGNLHPRWW